MACAHGLQVWGCEARQGHLALGMAWPVMGCVTSDKSASLLGSISQNRRGMEGEEEIELKSISS